MSKRCGKCEKTVYPTEELKCLDKVWHKMCFKCQVCNMTLNMKNYKGFDKMPYCNAHYPTQKATVVADTPEIRRIAANTAIQSQVKYHEDFEKDKGKKISVADDPETQRARKNMETVSNVAYHNELTRREEMEKNRPQEKEATAYTARRNPGSISDYDPMTGHPKGATPYTSRQQQSTAVYDSRTGAAPQGYPQGSEPSDAKRYSSGSGSGFQNQTRKIGSISDYDPMNEQYGSISKYDQDEAQRSSYGHDSNARSPRNSYEPSNRNSYEQSNVAAVITPPASYEPESAVVESNLPPSEAPPPPPVEDDVEKVPPSLPVCPPPADQLQEVPPPQLEEEKGRGQLQETNIDEVEDTYRPPPPQQQQPYMPPQQQARPTRQSNNPRYKALYDYTAADSDEISFLEDDIIVNPVIIDQGWMEGTNQRTGQRGMLPSNYVESM